MSDSIHPTFAELLPGEKTQGRVWFLMYAAFFLAFALNVLPANIAMASVALLFLSSPMEVMPFLYFFSLPWMYVARFDFGLTLSLVQSVAYLGKAIAAKQTFRFSRLELTVLLYLVAESFFGFLRDRSTTMLSFVFYFLIVCHVRNAFFRDPDNRRAFLRNMLFSIMVSVGIATIYGFMNGTSHARYISGIGYASQMHGTMGTTRFAMYLLIAILYPLYFVDDKKWKVILCVLGSAGVIATVSMTALVVMGLFWAYYFLMLRGKWKTLLLVSAVGCVVLLAGTLLWNLILDNPFLSPMAMRVELTIERLRSGDVDTATSGRENLFDSYFGQYFDANVSEQLFGNQTVRIENEMQFSHNSYVDMLNCIGFFGALLVFCLQISRVREHFRYPERNLLLMLKFVVLLTAASVSIFTAQFWQVFLYF